MTCILNHSMVLLFEEEAGRAAGWRDWTPLLIPRAPSYLNSRSLGYVTIGYIEPSSYYLGNWSPRELCLEFRVWDFGDT